MNFPKAPWHLTLCFLASFSTPSANAGLLLDDFLSGTGSNELMTAPPSATINRSFTGLAGTFGSTRDVAFSNSASVQSATLFFLDSPNPISGHPVAAGINNGSRLFDDEWSQTSFTWDNGGAGLNLDLSTEKTLTLEWQPDHLANGKSTLVSVSLLDNFGIFHTEVVTYSNPLLNPGFLKTDFALSSFSGNGVDLSAIDTAGLVVETDIAGDYTFVEFAAVSVATNPEPSSALLLIMVGTIFFLMFRPRRQSVPA